MTVYLDNKTAELIIMHNQTSANKKNDVFFIEFGKNAPWYVGTYLGWVTRKVLKKHFTYVGRL